MEDADSRTGGIFIRDMACFHCYSMNRDSQFSESQRKHAVSRMKIPPVRESASSLLCALIQHSRYFHQTYDFTSMLKSCIQACLILQTLFLVMKDNGSSAHLITISRKIICISTWWDRYKNTLNNSVISECFYIFKITQHKSMEENLNIFGVYRIPLVWF